ncbi:PREDICTED: uncharacterized protein LOC101309100 [Fragaria vesca subsp. vesca]|uniref:uncharacterized protein LOC101309100 n=1 Tax=Fragaria vesca subsp. vesca TaxID=101020 RepID=UPI0002C32A68|nr:PREDICTED: uncharacterized protein LOC101309100 [Fragaria vesca subsp. vesca]
MTQKLETAESSTEWRFTWESQSHIPTLRLFLFNSSTNSSTNPSTQCHNLTVHLSLPHSLLLLTWTAAADAAVVSLCVPMPRVLLDDESPVSFKALDDHIEVKLALLLPVDHSIVLNFESLLSLGEMRLDEDEDNGLKPLSVDSDVKSLSARGEVHFYCRSCSYKLTASPLSTFVEMPSVNWREVADNWFGNCCCSFGEVSEKLVAGYANSYTSKMGVCLVSSTNITLCKDDLVGCEFPDSGVCERRDNESDASGECGPKESELAPGSNVRCNEIPKSENKEKYVDASCKSDATEDEDKSEGVPHRCSESDCSVSESRKERDGDCDDMESHAQNYDGECCSHHLSKSSSEQNTEILKNHKSLLNGYLENIFMVRSSNLSVDVEWVEFFCPHCSSLLGAYPCDNGGRLIDGGVRLFKCNIATSLPVGGTRDVFRKYTLERMFANQLLECAKDQLSYRTVVKDLKLRSPMLQIVLINTNSWSGTGHCLATQGNTEPVPKIDLHPVIKVLFSECSSSTEAQLRMLEDSVTKDVVEEVFMLTHQIEELMKFLSARRDTLPPSCSSLEGLSLSSIPM